MDTEVLNGDEGGVRNGMEGEWEGGWEGGLLWGEDEDTVELMERFYCVWGTYERNIVLILYTSSLSAPRKMCTS